MKTLIQRILRKEKKPLIEKTLNDDEIEPFFKTHGIDLDTIGFPNTRSFDPHYVYFTNVILTPVKVDGVVKTIITGKYEEQARCGYKDSSGSWHPATPCKYSFRIEDGNLSLRRKK